MHLLLWLPIGTASVISLQPSPWSDLDNDDHLSVPQINVALRSSYTPPSFPSWHARSSYRSRSSSRSPTRRLSPTRNLSYSQSDSSEEDKSPNEDDDEYGLQQSMAGMSLFRMEVEKSEARVNLMNNLQGAPHLQALYAELDGLLEGSSLNLWQAILGGNLGEGEGEEEKAQRMVDFLLHLLSRPAVREMAIWALGNLGEELGAQAAPAIPALIDLAEQGHGNALYALSELVEKVELEPEQTTALVRIGSRALGGGHGSAMDACTLLRHLDFIPSDELILQLLRLAAEATSLVALSALNLLTSLLRRHAQLVVPLLINNGERLLVHLLGWLDGSMAGDFVFMICKFLLLLARHGGTSVVAKLATDKLMVLKDTTDDDDTRRCIAQIIELL